ncbi:MAG: TetR/AcrR family transcriptional regulator [Spirochaetaceae bacterium]|nr:TetR/AcrR family transcriptional regulator [Spirochaetaceae bacterium]
MNSQSESDTKLKILEAARKLFAEKSFSDVAVSEVAEQAAVSKSLIYYYFKSKDEILSALIDIFVADFTTLAALKFKVAANGSCGGSKEEYDTIFLPQMELFKKHKDVIKILFMEAIKGNQQGMVLFSLINRLMNESAEIIDDKEMNDVSDKLKNNSEMQAAVFFFQFLPVVSYFCLEEQWLSWAKADKQKINELYFKLSYQAHKRLSKTLGDMFAL